jgi:RNA polymerase sigma factor (sigma-70 family)
MERSDRPARDRVQGALREEGPPTEAIVAGLLSSSSEAVGIVARWAQEVALHRAWGFERPEDLVQTALLALVQNLRDGRFVGGDLRAYVRRITKNICVSSYRRARVRGPAVGLEEDGAMARAAAAGGAEIESQAMVRRILLLLDPPCRQLIAWAYLHGHDRREIAGRLGISEGATRVRLSRCLERARAVAGS